jgi:hypothetical protein
VLLLLLACDTGPEQQQHTASYIVHALHATDTVHNRRHEYGIARCTAAAGK